MLLYTLFQMAIYIAKMSCLINNKVHHSRRVHLTLLVFIARKTIDCVPYTQV